MAKWRDTMSATFNTSQDKYDKILNTARSRYWVINVYCSGLTSLHTRIFHNKMLRRKKVNIYVCVPSLKSEHFSPPSLSAC